MKTKEYNIAKCREYRQRRRLRVLSHYGNGKIECSCCLEKTLEFLSVDHIDGGGTKQKKMLKTRDMYALLIRLNFPLGYRILCHNCNQAIGFYGKCPHKG